MLEKIDSDNPSNLDKILSSGREKKQKIKLPISKMKKSGLDLQDKSEGKTDIRGKEMGNLDTSHIQLNSAVTQKNSSFSSKNQKFLSQREDNKNFPTETESIVSPDELRHMSTDNQNNKNAFLSQQEELDKEMIGFYSHRELPETSNLNLNETNKKE